jgi:hypothetical protein
LGSNGVVSIRVDGVSITIVDGNITIERTGASSAPKVAGAGLAVHEASADTPEESAATTNGMALASATESVAQFSNGADDSGWDPDELALVTTPPPGRPRPGGPPWSEEELERLRALYPTHSASAIAAELGRPFNSVRSKAQKLGLTRDGPPAVTGNPQPRQAMVAAKPKSLSAAAAVDSISAPNGRPFCAAVSLLEHHAGQCRWLVSDVWPALYCGAPVVNKSSWCQHHFGRVFTGRTASVGGFQLKGFAW